MAFGALCALEFLWGFSESGTFHLGWGGGLRANLQTSGQSNPVHPGQRLRGATGGGCSKEGRTWAPQPTCLEGAVFFGGWTPTCGGRARASAVLGGLAREHEMFGANRAAGLSCGQRRLPRRGDTKDLSGWPSESPSATPPSLSSRDSM